MVPPENSSPELLRQLHNDPEPSAEEELQKEEDLEASQNAAGASPTEEAKAAPAEAEEESGEKEDGAAAAEKAFLKEELVSEVKKHTEAASGAAEHDGEVEASAAGARAAAAPAAQEVGDKDAPPADETEGLKAFADETDCGPLCKLERLVDKLSK